MKKYFLIVIASTITTFLFACKIKPPKWVIKLAQNTGLKVVQGSVVVNRTQFIFDPNAMPSSYQDRHYHLQLPKGQ